MAKKTENGQVRCPKCGATDVALDVASGKLKCNFCRTLFDDESANAKGGVEKLEGRKVAAGAKDIIPDEEVILTLKCGACGADVVINTDEATNARCHWCRHVLSINEKQPNGAVPDIVLPFKLEKAKAESAIREFVKQRQFFAHPIFKKEFTTENIMGVYLPYMVVDVNAHAKLSGEAEHKIRQYTVKTGKTTRTYYDADVYDVAREFDMFVDDLTVEASKDKLKQDTSVDSKNVINAVMPFDTENAVAWDARYLRGFASEKRDTDVGNLDAVVKVQAQDIARYQALASMSFYDRGVKWTKEELEVKGSEWKAAYLPIWLYSYMDEADKKKIKHYVAVNARTGEASGSVPVFKAKLMAVSVLVEILGIIVGANWLKFWFLDMDVDEDSAVMGLFGLAGFTPGFIFYWVKMNKYRSLSARHHHERETTTKIDKLKKKDVKRETRKKLSSSRIAGENSLAVHGKLVNNKKLSGEKVIDFLGSKDVLGDEIGGALKNTLTKEK